MLAKALNGFNVTVFAYGQTGSGKTFTLEGSREQNAQTRGLVYHAIEDLFGQIGELKNRIFTVQCSFLQIYNEKIYDLLNQKLSSNAA